MAVYDRWHRDPQEGDKACEHSRGRNRLYGSAIHGRGDRWQVRYRHPETGRQIKKNFALRDPGPGELPDPDKHASAYDAVIRGSIVRRNYTDPNAGNVLLKDYAETWRKSRTHGHATARMVESRLRNHVYEGDPDSGRTPKGGVSIGQHPMGLLASRPSLSAAWIAAMPLAKGAKRMVVVAVSAICDAAVEDGVIPRNPLRSSAVDKPGRGDGEAQPYTAAEADGIAAGMDSRYRVMPRLVCGTGMRQMEMSGLGADDVHAAGRRPRVRVARQLLAVEGELCFAPLKSGGKPRDVPLAAPVARALDDHMRQFPPVTVTLPWHEPDSKLHGQPVTVRLVLTRPDGTPLTRGSSGGAWETGVRRLLRGKVLTGKGRRTRGWNIHRGRHTAASAWLRSGVDIVRVAAWLGDTVQVVADTYAHVMPDDHDGERAGRDAMEAFFRDDPSAPGVPSEDAV